MFCALFKINAAPHCIREKKHHLKLSFLIEVISLRWCSPYPFQCLLFGLTEYASSISDRLPRSTREYNCFCVFIKFCLMSHFQFIDKRHIVPALPLFWDWHPKREIMSSKAVLPVLVAFDQDYIPSFTHFPSTSFSAFVITTFF
jgi:hypothetical protein